MLSFFFFNVTPTTEIDTYGHTLSLHAALPISAARAFSDGANEPTKGTAVATPATPPTAQAEATQKRREGSGGRLRSEEHTSELQSLMRISYAVFCLKKKNRHNIETTMRNLIDKKKCRDNNHT